MGRLVTEKAQKAFGLIVEGATESAQSRKFACNFRITVE
jgi:hypothetical protein